MEKTMEKIAITAAKAAGLKTQHPEETPQQPQEVPRYDNIVLI